MIGMTEDRLTRAFTTEPIQRAVQVGITDADGNPVRTIAKARRAMAQAFGVPHYDGEIENDFCGDEVFLVDFPDSDYQELTINGYWGRENEDGYSVKAKWPDSYTF